MFGTLSKRESSPLTRWPGPWGAFRDMDDLFRSYFGELALPASEVAVPSVDVAETATAVEVTTDVPGYTASEVNIDVHDDSLTISGKHEEESTSDEEGKKYHRVERRTGSFSRYVQLPCAVNREKTEAELKNGVLKISLPKAQPAATRKVKIKG
jgi:HSP20 family protein